MRSVFVPYHSRLQEDLFRGSLAIQIRGDILIPKHKQGVLSYPLIRKTPPFLCCAPLRLLNAFMVCFRYCLDNRRALERDVAFAELQTRLIRYETQTTCTKESCPVPCALSPLPSPAVLSEPGSVPDGESLQRELQTEASRLQRRSKDLDSFHPNKR